MGRAEDKAGRGGGLARRGWWPVTGQCYYPRWGWGRGARFGHGFSKTSMPRGRSPLSSSESSFNLFLLLLFAGWGAWFNGSELVGR